MKEDNAAGPHGGTWIKTPTGRVEISVYEAGVPPHFRLYFFEEGGRPKPPVTADQVSLTTVRPDAGRQQFEFVHEPGCLRSTTDIPEPHEFAVELRLGGQTGDVIVYTTQFTEEGHGHAHAGGNGPFAWLQNTFGHSHSAKDKIDATMESNERGIWALKVSLVGLLITSSIQLGVVLVSGSVSLLADTIHNFGDAATSLPLWVAFALTKRGASRHFTYGYGRTEDVAGVAIVGMIFLSACVAMYESVVKILHPQPISHLWAVALAALVGFIGNEAVAMIRIKVGKEIGSAALVADGHHARVDGFTSLAVLFGVLGVYLGYPLADPIVGILITLAILVIVKDASVAVFKRMLDAIEPEILNVIERAPLHVAGVQAVDQVRARWVGHQVYTDLRILVDENQTVAQAHSISQEVEDLLRHDVPSFGNAIVHTEPALAARPE